MMFSVLIPSVPERIEKMMALFNKIQAQISSINADVEILVLLDNRKRTIGYKREALVQSARGDYLAFVDDDDDVKDNYISSIVEAIKNNKADVIVFNQEVTINDGTPFLIHFGIEYENQDCHEENGKWIDITRKPFQVCVWKSSIAKSEHFVDICRGEDWDWCERLLKKVKTQYRIDETLEIYHGVHPERYEVGK
jgi:glycosyltransferase involved in cell wall biosynthesis